MKNRCSHYRRWFERIALLSCAMATFSCQATHADQQAQPAPAQIGARLPFLTYHAINGQTSGERLESWQFGQIAAESVTRACIKLTPAARAISWKLSAPANTIVVRFCTPDAPTGGGQTSKINLLVNGTLRQQITLDSRYAWLYGTGENSQNNSPDAGPAHAFFDDAIAFITGAPLAAGDTLTLEHADAASPWTVIDLVDTEMVAPAPAMPAGYLSITDFGAKADDDQDDTDAILACIAAAREAGKGVWMPVGTFIQNKPIVVDGYTLRGAGPWYTILTATQDPPGGFAGNMGARLAGTGSVIADFRVMCKQDSRSKKAQRGLLGGGKNFVIDNFWTEHGNTGAWLGSCENGVIRNCRFRNTYADGININNKSNNVVLENIHTRSTGDDGIAVFSNPDHAGVNGHCSNITVRNNTCDSSWWGNGMGVYGSENIRVENNLIRSASRNVGLVVSTGFKSWPAKNIVIENNVILDSGGSAWKTAWGGMFIAAIGTDIDGLVIRNNRIERSFAEAVKINPGKGQLQLSFENNYVDTAGKAGIRIARDVTGPITFSANVFKGVPDGASPIVDLRVPESATTKPAAK